MIRRRGGFGTIVAILLLGLLTATLAGMVVASRGEYRRVIQAQQRAQLRQLMLAGTLDASIRMKSWNPSRPLAQWAVETPGQTQIVRVSVAEQSSNQVKLSMLTGDGSPHMQQTLRFVHAAETWKLTEIAEP